MKKVDVICLFLLLCPPGCWASASTIYFIDIEMYIILQ